MVACEELTALPCPQVHVQTNGAEVVVVFKHLDQVPEGVGAEHEVTGVAHDADGPVRVVEAHVFGCPRMLLVAHEAHVQLRPQAYVVLVYAAHGSGDALELLLLQRKGQRIFADVFDHVPPHGRVKETSCLHVPYDIDLIDDRKLDHLREHSAVDTMLETRRMLWNHERLRLARSIASLNGLLCLQLTQVPVKVLVLQSARPKVVRDEEHKPLHSGVLV